MWRRFPLPQTTVQEAEPVELVLPEAQLEQSDSALWLYVLVAESFKYLPAAHAVQLEALPVEYLPAAQIDAEAAPAPPEYRPAGAEVQAMAPDVLYVPAPHISHAADSVPVAALTSFFPPLQAVQNVEADELCLPAPQEVQEVDPSELYLPAPQVSHATDSVPVAALTSFFPPPHCVHTPCIS